MPVLKTQLVRVVVSGSSRVVSAPPGVVGLIKEDIKTNIIYYDLPPIPEFEILTKALLVD